MSPARYSRGCPKVWAVRHSAASKVKGVRGWDQQWSPCLPAEMLSLLYCPSSILLPGTSEGKLYGSSMPHNKVRPWKTYRGCETGQFPCPFTIHELAAVLSLLGDPGSAAPGPAAGHSLQGLHHSFPGTWPHHCPLTWMGTKASWHSTHTHF